MTATTLTEGALLGRLTADLTTDQSSRLEAGKLITAVRSRPTTGVEVQVIMRTTPRRVFDLITNYSSLSDNIVGLQSVTILERIESTDSTTINDVRFEMKLPFPVGRFAWSNRIEARQLGNSYSVAWTLLDGDLRTNEGRLSLAPYGEDGASTYACYDVSVASKTRLPRSAERLATRWLLPKIVGRLRRAVE